MLAQCVTGQFGAGNSLRCAAVLSYAFQRRSKGGKHNDTPGRPRAAHAEGTGRTDITDRPTGNRNFSEFTWNKECDFSTVWRPKGVGRVCAAVNSLRIQTIQPS